MKSRTHTPPAHRQKVIFNSFCSENNRKWNRKMLDVSSAKAPWIHIENICRMMPLSQKHTTSRIRNVKTLSTIQFIKLNWILDAGFWILLIATAWILGSHSEPQKLMHYCSTNLLDLSITQYGKYDPVEGSGIDIRNKLSGLLELPYSILLTQLKRQF